MINSVDVIVLTTTRSAELLQMHMNMLTSFVSTRPDNCRLIVLENNAHGSFQDTFKSEVLGSGMEYHYIDGPFNMNSFFNIGTKLSTSKFVCYANSDIVFYPEWCENLTRWFSVMPELVCACPVTMCDSPWSVDAVQNDKSLHLYRSGQVLQREFVTSYDLAGWFYCFKREFIYAHPWDERFNAHFQDNDMFKFLEHNHYLAGVAQDSRVDHIVGGSFSKISSTEKLKFSAGREAYDNKWDNLSVERDSVA